MPIKLRIEYIFLACMILIKFVGMSYLYMHESLLHTCACSIMLDSHIIFVWRCDQELNKQQALGKIGKGGASTSTIWLYGKREGCMDGGYEP